MQNTQAPTLPPSPVTTRKAWPLDEARELLGGVSRKTIYDLINSGELQTVNIGGRRLVPDFALNDLLDRRATEPFKPICTGRNVPASA